MGKIHQIIREEIEKYILSENIDFRNLINFSTNLQKQTNVINNMSYQQTDPNLKKFFNGLTIYCLQIINAINRCVKAKNLNESFKDIGRLSDYGINIPPELGGNVMGDFFDTARNTYQNLRATKMQKYTNNQRGYNTSNNVPSIRLSELLSQLPNKQASFNSMNSKYNIDNMTQVPRNILFTIIPTIQQEYNTQSKNAQGTP